MEFKTIEKGALIDCHLHLQEAVFSLRLEEVLERAARQGVGRFVCNGIRESDWPQVLAIAQKHPQVIPCFGLHPWQVRNRSPRWLEELEKFLTLIPSGIGEVGLDFHIDDRDEAAQVEVFRAQLALARRLNRPVMIHCVHAWEKLLEILREEPPPAYGIMLHAFGGDAKVVEPLCEFGAWFSFSGVTFDPKKTVRRQVLPLIPRDRLLVETDSPDMLPPEPYRPFVLLASDGRRLNEPANLPAILKGIAELLHEEPEALACQIVSNSRRFLSEILPKSG